MLPSAFQKKHIPFNFINIKKSVGMLSVVFLFIIGLSIFQDFLESYRSGYSFHFSESILFKTIWILFIPLLAVLSKILKNQNLNSFGKTTFFIVASILIHLLILPFVFLFFSVLFYHGRYDLYKILSYTLANDLYKLVLIYAAFIVGYRYLSNKVMHPISSNEKSYIQTILINNGKNNTVVEIQNIYQITADTPYIAIQLENKKHLHKTTLKSISAQLNHNKFVRIHKSTIVNLDKVVSFKSRLNGDYDILLNNGTELRLSRTYATNFKSKFKHTHQVSI
ncbi:LytR/AlgR family response regulator transcription factor [Kordia sp.]|uniref:LytR/AlgR family response regulator transcription factor n=1 Tax=Kordia sp. TaxID=1965332 RepID=UPI003D277A4B